MKFMCAAVLVSAGLVLPAHAQMLDFSSTGQAADLRCPAPRSAPKKKPASPAVAAEVLAPPEPDEVAALTDDEAAPAVAELLDIGVQTPGRVPSIAFWGDSHLAAHFFGDELIRLSGLPRNRVLPGFIPATLGRAGVRLPVRKHCLSAGWTYRLAYLAKEPGGAFPPSLVVARNSTPESYLWVDFRLNEQTPALRSVDVLFQPAGGAEPVLLGVRVDDAPEQIVTLDAASGRLQIRADQAMSVLRLRLVSGELALEGFAPHYLETGPALRMDTFAIPSAMAKGWANASPDYLRAHPASSQYDLIALEYGTNEGNAKPFSAAAYASDLRQALGNLRQVYPESRCVLIGPTDRGVLVKTTKARSSKKAPKGKKTAARPKTGRAKVVASVPKPKAAPSPELLRYASIHQEIGALQRSIGREFDCSFWSWQDAMGGPGGAYRWFYRSPAWMARDLIHLTVPGYQASARSFAESIRFQTWVNNGVEQP